MVMDTTATDLDMDTTTARGLLSLLLSPRLLLTPRPIPTTATTASATTAMVLDTTATDLDMDTTTARGLLSLLLSLLLLLTPRPIPTTDTTASDTTEDTATATMATPMPGTASTTASKKGRSAN